LKKFIINNRANPRDTYSSYKHPGFHELHRSDCPFVPEIEELKTEIGLFHDCYQALKSLKKGYPNKKFNGCYFCCFVCHQSP